MTILHPFFLAIAFAKLCRGSAPCGASSPDEACQQGGHGGSALVIHDG